MWTLSFVLVACEADPEPALPPATSASVEGAPKAESAPKAPVGEASASASAAQTVNLLSYEGPFKLSALPTDPKLSPEFHDIPRDLDFDGPEAVIWERLKGLLPKAEETYDPYQTYFIEDTVDGRCRALVFDFLPDDHSLTSASVQIFPVTCEALRAKFAADLKDFKSQ